MKITKLLTASLMVLATVFAHAAKLEGAPTSTNTSCEGLRFASGKVGKGYNVLYNNLNDVTNKSLNLCSVDGTTGGLDNLSLLSKKKADVAFAQLDQLQYLAKGDPNVRALRVVATLNSNYLHIVVKKSGVTITGDKKLWVIPGDKAIVVIKNLTELKGRRVVLVGSAKLLGQQLNKDMQLNLDITEADTDEEAFAQVQKEQVFAALTVAGWPHGPVDALTPAQGLTLAGFDGPSNNSLYSVKALTYKNIGVWGNVQALAIPNVLVARQFNTEKADQVVELKNALAKKLGVLKDGDYAPAWNEIEDLDAKVDWPKLEIKNTSTPNKVKK